MWRSRAWWPAPSSAAWAFAGDSVVLAGGEIDHEAFAEVGDDYVEPFALLQPAEHAAHALRLLDDGHHPLSHGVVDVALLDGKLGVEQHAGEGIVQLVAQAEGELLHGFGAA